MTGDDGTYRLYRRYPADNGEEQKLIARFAIVGGVVQHLEDRDGILEDIIPEGKLSDVGLRRLASMEHSAYWRLVNAQDTDGPDLLPEVDVAPPGAASRPGHRLAPGHGTQCREVRRHPGRAARHRLR